MILHIIEKEAWFKAQREGIYTPSSIKTDGFIHCSTSEQVVDVANFLYKGHTDLVLLCIDPNKVEAKIVYEDLYEAGKLFPHIYGSLNIAAVFKVIRFIPDRNEGFSLPKELTDLNS
ncbi:DUF952 domain-containing protein [Cytobacillus sp. IB215665]|uniref:DUF952 domain-containing protein n=1 Tax=Cytobacillus sp. IB215665 TaxID=3097357 RepID=UPI002A0BFA7E|nr:DUF952 domain-containing protein [Cytobacillus sp. IB215665]MDX8365379.1 DUF952 domain-containing protein [Cytobacillus sp. IB215665]